MSKEIDKVVDKVVDKVKGLEIEIKRLREELGKVKKPTTFWYEMCDGQAYPASCNNKDGEELNLFDNEIGYTRLEIHNRMLQLIDFYFTGSCLVNLKVVAVYAQSELELDEDNIPITVARYEAQNLSVKVGG